MKARRRRHDPELKARVALEALKGHKTISEIAREFDVHPVQVSDWKKTLQAGMAGVFGQEPVQSDSEERERERAQLHSKIGELTVKVDFLQKKSKQLGIWNDLPGWSKKNTQS